MTDSGQSDGAPILRAGLERLQEEGRIGRLPESSQSDWVSQGGEGRIVRAVRIEPGMFGDPATWASYRKRTYTLAIRIGPLTRPHVIETKEGDYHLAKGWEGAIAADADGDLYPIAKNVFEQTYEMVR